MYGLSDLKYRLIYFFNPLIDRNATKFCCFENIADLCKVKIATIILSLFMFFKPVLPVVEYVVFYDYIKNELCVNKDKPEMGCNGKCHLTKELAKASDTDTEKGRTHFASAEIQLIYYQAIETFHCVIQILPSIKTTVNVEDHYSFSFSNLLFRPPVYN